MKFEKYYYSLLFLFLSLSHKQSDEEFHSVTNRDQYLATDCLSFKSSPYALQDYSLKHVQSVHTKLLSCYGRVLKTIYVLVNGFRHAMKF